MKISDNFKAFIFFLNILEKLPITKLMDNRFATG